MRSGQARDFAMTSAIPVIDVADYLAGRPGALQATARRMHDALSTVGFLVLTGHDVPQSLIAQTFGEAKRLHDLPMASKLALRLNEHNTGYMAMGQAGMADMATMVMPQPTNSISMVGGKGPHGSIDMGGMFTLVKIRDKLGADPGWYAAPAATNQMIQTRTFPI